MRPWSLYFKASLRNQSLWRLALTLIVLAGAFVDGFFFTWEISLDTNQSQLLIQRHRKRPETRSSMRRVGTSIIVQRQSILSKERSITSLQSSALKRRTIFPRSTILCELFLATFLLRRPRKALLITSKKYVSSSTRRKLLPHLAMHSWGLAVLPQLEDLLSSHSKSCQMILSSMTLSLLSSGFRPFSTPKLALMN